MPVSASNSAGVDQAFVRGFIERTYGAWHSHDPENALALMDDGIVYHDSASPTAMRGHDEVRAFLQWCWRAFPDLRFELLDGPFLHPHEPKASDCWRCFGTHTGPINPPGFSATGKQVEFDGMTFLEFRDGRLSRLSFVFDTADVLRQLGLLPKSGSRAERGLAGLQRLRARLTPRTRV